MNNDKRIALIKKWADLFMSNTDSWEGDLGLSLAYLFPAMANDKVIEVFEGDKILEVLSWMDLSPTDKEEIWKYLILGED